MGEDALNKKAEMEGKAPWINKSHVQLGYCVQAMPAYADLRPHCLSHLVTSLSFGLSLLRPGRGTHPCWRLCGCCTSVSCRWDFWKPHLRPPPC